MVQSLGISIGNFNSYVAAGQAGGVEILLNEYSQRSTPSMIAFSDQVRVIGVDAASNFFMNMNNTVYDLMLLLGKPYKDIQLEDFEGKPIYPFKLEEGPNGEAHVVVRHLGVERKFTLTQVLAMLFTKLRDIAGQPVDCVMSCPQFFGEPQKSALMQAALVAGLNPLRIITDMSAVIFNYAYYRTTKEDKDKFVVFINFGQSNLQTAVAWLSPKDDIVKVLTAESELVGGRDFDRCLAEYFISSHNLELNLKAKLKLISSCEKLKRLLSANTNEIPISVESLLGEDKDFNGRIDRATFETNSKPILQRVEDCLTRTLQNARINFDKIMAETLEAAQAAEVARAAESVKVAELAKDVEVAKQAKLVAQAKAAAEALAKVDAKNSEESKEDTPAEENKETPMEAESEELTKAKDDEQKAAQALKAAKSAEKSMSSQANRLTKLAQLKFELHSVEIVGGSSRVPAFRQMIKDIFGLTPSTTLNTDEAVTRGCVLDCATLHPGMKVKREVKIVNSEPYSKPSGMTCDKDFRRLELELITEDRKYRARTEARNQLEEYIYLERSKLQEGDQFLQQLSDNLDWLFTDEGEDATEEIYTGRLNDLKKVSESRLVETNQSGDGSTEKAGS